MNCKMTFILLYTLTLVWVSGVKAQPVKDRVDLTGRQDLTAEEIIQGLTPRPTQTSRTRGITRGVEPVLATIAVTVHFAFDSSEILPQAATNLNSLGQALESPRLAPYRILIEGHTDSIGSAEYNQGLSLRRAQSVKLFLTQNFDISPGRLVTAGRGEVEPLSDNRTSAGRQKNRRAEFVNLGPQ